ncbi:hypothetical protein Nepgr_021346 [Nepenthes gracilis]|uniref:Uncharacterized protein n=1 Tax=Nepenthes gracilis TaxID=150966 RepID=A0AAD3SXC3_NEPGR|nr:hypothetical protein Nepgr_021346 [Nepenthes gracilis]
MLPPVLLLVAIHRAKPFRRTRGFNRMVHERNKRIPEVKDQMADSDSTSSHSLCGWSVESLIRALARWPPNRGDTQMMQLNPQGPLPSEGCCRRTA